MNNDEWGETGKNKHIIFGQYKDLGGIKNIIDVVFHSVIEHYGWLTLTLDLDNNLLKDKLTFNLHFIFQLCHFGS